MTDHILGTTFNKQNLVPVKKGHGSQRVANCRKPRLSGKFLLIYLESLFLKHDLATIYKKIDRK